MYSPWAGVLEPSPSYPDMSVVEKKNQRGSSRAVLKVWLALLRAEFNRFEFLRCGSPPEGCFARARAGSVPELSTCFPYEGAQYCIYVVPQHQTGRGAP